MSTIRNSLTSIKLLFLKKQLLLKVILINFLMILNSNAQKKSLWGTWESGGENYAGSVYSIDENGEGFKTLHSFTKVIGKWPKGSLIKGDSDTFYGIASGGLYSGGVLFQYDLGRGLCTVLHNFKGEDGWEPQGGLVLVKNILYGVTNEGGKNGKGTLFSYNLDRNILNIEHDFSDKELYSDMGKKSKLVLSDEALYGVTEYGGAYNKGTLYSFHIQTKKFSTRIDFNDDIGVNPIAALTVGPEGLLFGTTTKGRFFIDDKLFQYNTKNAVLKELVSFKDVEGNIVESQMTFANDSILIGIASYGGLNKSGVIFEYDILNHKYTPTVHLSANETGSRSKGTLCVSENNEVYALLSNGGPNHCGTLIHYNYQNKKVKIVHTFNKQQGYDFDNGLLFLDKNTLIGLARSGGENTKYGNLFTLNLVDKHYEQLLNFGYSPMGSKPVGDLVLYDRFVYGITENGGKNNHGTIYRIAVKNERYEKLIDLSDYGISNISGGLCLGTDGKMYGFSGNSSSGSSPRIFYYHPQNNSITTLLKFEEDKELDRMTLNKGGAVEIIKRNNVLVKYTDNPDNIDLNTKQQETDAVAVVTKSSIAKYPFERFLGPPMFLNNKLYGHFSVNNTLKNSGIFSCDLKTENLNILTYFAGNGIGNFIASGNTQLYYVGSDERIDSLSLTSENNFDKDKSRPYGYVNKKNGAYYYFPYTSDGLYRKSPTDSISKHVVIFGIAGEFEFSRKKINSENPNRRDLARIFIKDDNGRLIEKDSFNVKITGSVLKGPLTEYKEGFFGVTRFGGKYGSGVFFKYSFEENRFENLYNFPLRKGGYNDGVPSSLIMVIK